MAIDFFCRKIWFFLVSSSNSAKVLAKAGITIRKFRRQLERLVGAINVEKHRIRIMQIFTDFFFGSCKEIVQQKPSFQEKTRFLFMLCTLFLYEPLFFNELA